MKELLRKIEPFHLNILGQAQCDGAGLGGGSKHTKRFRKGRQQLFGTLYTVPISRDRFETVVNGNVLR
jgi:hypothetical protein